MPPCNPLAWCCVLSWCALTLETGRLCYLNGREDQLHGEDGLGAVQETLDVVDFLCEEARDAAEAP